MPPKSPFLKEDTMKLANVDFPTPGPPVSHKKPEELEFDATQSWKVCRRISHWQDPCSVLSAMKSRSSSIFSQIPRSLMRRAAVGISPEKIAEGPEVFLICALSPESESLTILSF